MNMLCLCGPCHQRSRFKPSVRQVGTGENSPVGSLIDSVIRSFESTISRYDDVVSLRRHVGGCAVRWTVSSFGCSEGVREDHSGCEVNIMLVRQGMAVGLSSTAVGFCLRRDRESYHERRQAHSTIQGGGSDRLWAISNPNCSASDYLDVLQCHDRTTALIPPKITVSPYCTYQPLRKQDDRLFLRGIVILFRARPGLLYQEFRYSMCSMQPKPKQVPVLNNSTYRYRDGYPSKNNATSKIEKAKQRMQITLVSRALDTQLQKAMFFAKFRPSLCTYLRGAHADSISQFDRSQYYCNFFIYN